MEQKQEIIEQPIGRKQIGKAQAVMKAYKSGKENLEERIVSNEKWFQMRHWDTMRKIDDNDPKPASGWLFNCIISKHADFMDAYPDVNILPREEGDKKEARMLSSIIPVVMDQNKFEETWDDTSWYKVKMGTGCYGVFWDSSKLNGMGDISIKQIDLLNLFWEPGVRDIQSSRNIFYAYLVDLDVLEGTYPHVKGKIKEGEENEIKKYVYDENISTSGKCLVVDWYYHKIIDGKSVLHFCKFCQDEVLYASENDEELREKGWYHHGKYPFVFDVLFREEGMPTGFGFVDVCKEAQESIDRLNNDIEINARWGARPRWFMRQDGSINEEEYKDLSKQIVHVSGNLGEDSLRRIESEKLDGTYLSILQAKIEELKETSGNRDVSNGGTTSGVTAASGIAALQEQAGKTSRDMIMTSYRAYENVVEMVIELIRQFYDLPRKFRIIGSNGQEEFTTYTNEGLKEQYQGNDFGEDMGYRLPVFDIKVSAQKKNPYSKVSQNELALQLYDKGFFNPQMCEQALACLDVMDFDGKDGIIQKITRNGTMYQQMMQMQAQMLQMAQMLDQLQGSNLTESVSQNLTGSMQMPSAGGSNKIYESDSLGGLKTEENKIVERARARANESTQPRG